MNPAKAPGSTRQAHARQLRATAYHEAGHAVAAHFSRSARRATEVSIVRLGDSLGRVRSSRRLTEVTAVPRLLDECTVFLAGAIAEREFLGRCSHAGADSDYRAATDLALQCSGSPEQASALIALCRVRARDLVRVRRKAIEAVANALLAERTLTRERLIQVIDASHGLEPLQLSKLTSVSGIATVRLRVRARLNDVQRRQLIEVAEHQGLEAQDAFDRLVEEAIRAAHLDMFFQHAMRGGAP